MGVEISWSIKQMVTGTTDSGQSGYVYEVVWDAVGNYNGKTTDRCATVRLNVDPNAENFIPYDELTEAIVLGWVFDALGPDGVSTIEMSITEQLMESGNGLEAPPIPW